MIGNKGNILCALFQWVLQLAFLVYRCILGNITSRQDTRGVSCDAASLCRPDRDNYPVQISRVHQNTPLISDKNPGNAPNVPTIHEVKCDIIAKYKCSVCSRVFKQKCDLVVHFRTHTGERPYVCQICSKAFRQRQHLKEHVVVHSSEKPFMCRFCTERFRLVRYLKRHYKIKHREIFGIQ